jgi:hypothetical protein
MDAQEIKRLNYARYRLGLNRRAAALLQDADRYEPAGKYSLRGWTARLLHGVKEILNVLERASWRIEERGDRQEEPDGE